MPNRRTGAVLPWLVTLILLSACASTTAPSSSPTTTAKPPRTATAAAPPPSTPVSRTVNWFDLDVGECLADPPPVDPNVISVPVVDCETPHHAEVYLRVPLAVNTAIADVANRKCKDGFTAYTGEPVGSGTLSVTYLIDSNQNRTSSNPDPSTVICLLQSASGAPLTVPAHR